MECGVVWRDVDLFCHLIQTIIVEQHMTEAERVTVLLTEIERLLLENMQLKGALGYPVPGNIPEGPWRCGVCAARAQEQCNPAANQPGAINWVSP